MGSAHCKIGNFEVGVACRGWTCFDGNTLVTLKNGSTQTMRNLKPGERILTVDRATGKQVFTQVTMRFKTSFPYKILFVILSQMF